MIVELPISSFSKAILTTEYPTLPLKYKPQDPLFQLLFIQKPYNQFSKNTSLRKLLDSHIQIRMGINKVWALNVQSDEFRALRIGYNIHKYHVRQFHNFIYARVLLNDAATNSIVSFNKINGITEDIFPYESQLRSWQRFWRAKKTAVKEVELFSSSKNSFEEVLYLTNIPLSQYEVKLVIKELQSDVPHYFELRSKPKFREHLELFLLKNFSEISNKGLKRKFKIKFNSIYSLTRKFEKYLNREKTLKRILLLSIQQVKEGKKVLS